MHDTVRYSPAFILVIAAVWLGRDEQGLLGGSDLPLLPFIPYGVALFGIGFAWWFKNSNAVFGFMILTLAYTVEHILMQDGITKDALGQVIYPGLAILLPLNFAALMWINERGVLTAVGLWRLVIFCAQAMLLIGVAYVDGGRFAGVAGDILHFRFGPSSWDMWTHLPQPALLAYILGAVLIAVRLVKSPVPINVGWVAVYISSFFALNAIGSPFQVALFYSACVLALTFSMFQESYRMAFLDELTGMPARRALIADMNRLGGHYVVAMSDIDHFKKFNDTYGHDVGDQVLRMVAQKLGDVTGGGKAYRYGGEEFTILFPGKDLEEVLPHLDEVRLIIEKSSFNVRDKNRPKTQKKNAASSKKKKARAVQVQISIGVAEKDTGHASPMDVMKSADQALYRAKDAGRNQVSV